MCSSPLGCKLPCLAAVPNALAFATHGPHHAHASLVGCTQKLVDRLKRERFRAIFDYLRRGAPAPVLNLVEAVQVGAGSAVWGQYERLGVTSDGRDGHSGAALECWPSLPTACASSACTICLPALTLQQQDEEFMDTIDPEVRADVEFAARLLGKAISRRQAAEGLQVSLGGWGARAIGLKCLGVALSCRCITCTSLRGGPPGYQPNCVCCSVAMSAAPAGLRHVSGPRQQPAQQPAQQHCGLYRAVALRAIDQRRGGCWRLCGADGGSGGAHQGWVAGALRLRSRGCPLC